MYYLQCRFIFGKARMRQLSTVTVGLEVWCSVAAFSAHWILQWLKLRYRLCQVRRKSVSKLILVGRLRFLMVIGLRSPISLLGMSQGLLQLLEAVSIPCQVVPSCSSQQWHIILLLPSTSDFLYL